MNNNDFTWKNPCPDASAPTVPSGKYGTATIGYGPQPGSIELAYRHIIERLAKIVGAPASDKFRSDPVEHEYLDQIETIVAEHNKK